jgi:hypothetical protein
MGACKKGHTDAARQRPASHHRCPPPVQLRRTPESMHASVKKYIIFPSSYSSSPSSPLSFYMLLLARPILGDLNMKSISRLSPNKHILGSRLLGFVFYEIRTARMG